MCLGWSALTKDCPLGLASGGAVLRCRGTWGPGFPTGHSLLRLSAGSTLRMGLALALQAVTWFCAQLMAVPAAGPAGVWPGSRLSVLLPPPPHSCPGGTGGTCLWVPEHRGLCQVTEVKTFIRHLGRKQLCWVSRGLAQDAAKVVPWHRRAASQ